MPQLWPALAVGGLLVALFVMSDFGAVSIMRFDSFTSEIYISYKSSFDRAATAGLGAVLVVLMVALLWISARIRNSKALHRLGPGAARPPRPYALGRWKAPSLAFCSAVVGIALVLPVGVLLYWSGKGISAGSTSWNIVGALAGNSMITATGAAIAGGVAALVVAVLAGRYPSALTRAIERFGHAGYALPGIVVALALVYFATRAATPVYQTLALLVFALTVHYLPLGIGPISTALAQVSPRVEEAARGLGRGPGEVFRTITAPLVRGGILAGAALIFLHAIKELPATLILAPIGFETLATEIWNQTSFGFYESSAIPSLVLLAIAAPPALPALRARDGELVSATATSAPLRLSGLRKHFGDRGGGRGGRPRARAGHDLRAARAVGVRQDDDAAPDRRPRAARRGRDPDRRADAERARARSWRRSGGGSGWCSRTTPSSPTSTSPATSATGSAAAPTRRGSPRSSTSSGSAPTPGAPSTSSPAGCSSGSRSPAPSRRRPT